MTDNETDDATLRVLRQIREAMKVPPDDGPTADLARAFTMGLTLGTSLLGLAVPAFAGRTVEILAGGSLLPGALDDAISILEAKAARRTPQAPRP